MAEILTKFESYDRMAAEAFLSPLEFASREYQDYLSYGGVHCTPIGGLFYEPVNKAILNGLRPYRRLREASKDWPIVFVFGGGGAVWLRLFQRIHEQAKAQIRDKNYTLLLPDVVMDKGELIRGKDEQGVFLFTLYRPDGAVIQQTDPGRLIYWYAACRLVVLRGGLAAQQVLALMSSDLDQVPQMLFVEQPGHPQIEHERLSLYNLGFAYSRTFANFDGNEFGVIEGILKDISTGPDPRYRVPVRYGKEMMKELTRCLLVTYSPFSG